MNATLKPDDKIKVLLEQLAELTGKTADEALEHYVKKLQSEKKQEPVKKGAVTPRDELVGLIAEVGKCHASNVKNLLEVKELSINDDKFNGICKLALEGKTNFLKKVKTRLPGAGVDVSGGKENLWKLISNVVAINQLEADVKSSGNDVQSKELCAKLSASLLILKNVELEAKREFSSALKEIKSFDCDTLSSRMDCLINEAFPPQKTWAQPNTKPNGIDEDKPELFSRKNLMAYGETLGLRKDKTKFFIDSIWNRKGISEAQAVQI